MEESEIVIGTDFWEDTVPTEMVMSVPLAASVDPMVLSLTISSWDDAIADLFLVVLCFGGRLNASEVFRDGLNRQKDNSTGETPVR